jgi:hypothetical protein
LQSSPFFFISWLSQVFIIVSESSLKQGTSCLSNEVVMKVEKAEMLYETASFVPRTDLPSLPKKAWGQEEEEGA